MFGMGIIHIKHTGVIGSDKNRPIRLINRVTVREEGYPVEVRHFLNDGINEFGGVSRRTEIGPEFTNACDEVVVPGADTTDTKSSTVHDGTENVSRMT